MTRNEWRESWRFVREYWPQIYCGDAWALLTPQQLIAASFLYER